MIELLNWGPTDTGDLIDSKLGDENILPQPTYKNITCGSEMCSFWPDRSCSRSSRAWLSPVAVKFPFKETWNNVALYIINVSVVLECDGPDHLHIFEPCIKGPASGFPGPWRRLSRAKTCLNDPFHRFNYPQSAHRRKWYI